MPIRLIKEHSILREDVDYSVPPSDAERIGTFYGEFERLTCRREVGAYQDLCGQIPFSSTTLIIIRSLQQLFLIINNSSAIQSTIQAQISSEFSRIVEFFCDEIEMIAVEDNPDNCDPFITELEAHAADMADQIRVLVNEIFDDAKEAFRILLIGIVTSLLQALNLGGSNNTTSPSQIFQDLNDLATNIANSIVDLLWPLYQVGMSVIDLIDHIISSDQYQVAESSIIHCSNLYDDAIDILTEYFHQAKQADRSSSFCSDLDSEISEVESQIHDKVSQSLSAKEPCKEVIHGPLAQMKDLYYEECVFTPPMPEGSLGNYYTESKRISYRKGLNSL